MTWRVSCPALVGRAEELAGLRSAIEAAGHQPVSFMVVSGAAGMGKTRLIGEVCGWAAKAGHTVAEGACLPLGQQLPYGPFAELLGPDLFIGSDAAASASRLALFRAAADALATRADGQRLVVVLEDLHWADASTCDLLVFCARALAGKPILIIGSYRTELGTASTPFATLLADLGSPPWLRRLELSPLTWAQTAQQIAGIRGTGPATELVDRVHARCGGNPFYAEELLAADPTARRLPGTLADAVLSRLDRLGPQARSVATVLAVTGPRTHHQLLLAACALDPAGIDGGIAALSAGGLITPVGPGYKFRHALAREAVLGVLGPAERTAAHRQIAELLTGRPELAASTGPAGLAAERAHHWEAAGEQARAFKETLAAARAAEAVLAPAETLAALERAIRLYDQLSDPSAPGRAAIGGTDRFGLLERAATAAIATGQYDRAIDLLTPVHSGLRVAADAERLATTMTQLSIAERERGRLDRSAALLEEAAGLLAGPPSAALATVLARQADLQLTQLRYEDCITAARRAIEVAQAAAAPLAEGVARLAMGRAICWAAAGSDEQGVSEMYRGLALTGQHGDLRTRTLAVYHTALVLRSLNRFVAALMVAKDGYEELSRLGASPDRLVMLRLAQAQALQRLGRLAEAETLLAVSEPSDTVADVIRRVALAEVAVLRGRLGEARIIFDRLRDDPRAAESQFQDVVSSLHVDLLAAEHRWDEARRQVLDGLRVACVDDPFDYRGCAAGLRLEADRAEAGLADEGTEPVLDELLAALGQLATRERRRRQPRPEASCYTALAEADAARARGADHPALWQRAVTAASATSEPWPVAYARYRLGVALAAGGSRGEARGLLAAARQIARGMGAKLLADEITAAAARFRVAADTGPPPHDPLARYQLTPRETEVLALVASGASNGEIAGQLFIGAKTASAHVTHILRKLGVSTRTQAAAIAYRGGLGSVPSGHR